MKSLLIIFLAFGSFTFLNLAKPITGPNTLSGIVSCDNAPLSGIKIEVFQNEKLVTTQQSAADGSYSCALAAGQYDAVFSMQGYETNRVLFIKVPEGQSVICHVNLIKSILPAQTVTWEWRYLTEEERPETLERYKDDIVRDLTPTSAVRPSTPAPKTEVSVASKPAPGMAEKRAKSLSIAMSSSSAEKSSDIITPAPTPSLPVSPSQPDPRAGLLTAGEWNDLDNWNKHWVDLIQDGEIDAHQKMYGFFPQHRYSVLLTNTSDFPIIDAPIALLNAQDEVVWECRTDNTGKAELWYSLFEKASQAPKLTIQATIDGRKKNLGQAKPFSQGINHFRLSRDCTSPNQVDIVWAVDATGSMGDEINYLKKELLDVIGRVKSSNPNLSMRMGTVFYRDKTDEYLVKSSGLSADISKTVDYIGEQSAGGGGDFPEAVHSALEEAIFQQAWRTDAVARICFLVLDASPHQLPEVNASLARSIREAAKKGIRIVPVTASGIQKDTEFLMKFFGLATNGTYVFLTDHSGIGGRHLEPTSDEYKVELLNNLLVRLIGQYTTVATCDGKSQIVFENAVIDSTQQHTAKHPIATFFPNPASAQFTLELPFDAQKVTLYDATGAAVFNIAQPNRGQHTVPVGQLPAGYYSIRIWAENQTQTGKILVIKA